MHKDKLWIKFFHEWTKKERIYITLVMIRFFAEEKGLFCSLDKTDDQRRKRSDLASKLREMNYFNCSFSQGVCFS